MSEELLDHVAARTTKDPALDELSRQTLLTSRSLGSIVSSSSPRDFC
ncbi:hypothetical protein IPZ58_30780 [Streptomyces roseoverticillatus]|nr:hypothetical protein [Streptomyces roseoverticillatus]MCF3105931.1 hypothetical protein [Streptomyces roseoverticillatus]